MGFLAWIIIIVLSFALYYMIVKYERKIDLLTKTIEQNSKHIQENRDLIEKNRLLIEKNAHNIQKNTQNITKIDVDLED